MEITQITRITESLKYKYELLKTAINTGDFNKVIHEIKLHVITNKNIYIVLTFLVILYTLYEQDSQISYKHKHQWHWHWHWQRQLGGTDIEIPEHKNTSDKHDSKNSKNTTAKQDSKPDSKSNSKPDSKNSKNTADKQDSKNHSKNDKGNNPLANNNSSSSASDKTSQLSQGVSGLCDGEGTIAKMCRGGKDGVTNYFKFFGYLILAGLAMLSPFVIYVVLVYMMLKIMFTGLKNI